MKQIYQAVIAILKKLFKTKCTQDCVQGRNCNCSPDAKINQNVIWMKNEK